MMTMEEKQRVYVDAVRYQQEVKRGVKKLHKYIKDKSAKEGTPEHIWLLWSVANSLMMYAAVLKPYNEGKYNG